MYSIGGRGLRAVLGAAVVMGLAAGAGEAQGQELTVGVVGGWSTGGDLTPGLGYESRLADGWVAGVQVGSWSPGSRTGWRATGTTASRAMEGEGSTFLVVAADVALMVRILRPAGVRVAEPFVGVGAGVVVYGAGAGQEPLGRGLFGSDPVPRLMLAPAVGVDLRTGSRAAIRLEIADQVVFPYVGISPASDGVHRAHNPGVRAAAQLRLGRTRTPPAIPRVATPPGRDAEPAARPVPEERPPPLEPPPPPSPPQPPEAAPPVMVPVPPGPPLFTVQVGAFAEPGAARDLAGRLDGTGLPVWLSPTAATGERLVRVRVGVVRSREEAGLLARRLMDSLGVETWVAAMAPGEEIPGDALAITLRALFPR
jgi:cell division septation protein DedD